MAELKASKLRKAPYFLIPLLDSAIFRDYTPDVNVVAKHIEEERSIELLYVDRCTDTIRYQLKKEPNGDRWIVVTVDYSGCAERAVEEAIAERSSLPIYLYLMKPIFNTSVKDWAIENYIMESEFITDRKERDEIEWLKQMAEFKLSKRKLKKEQISELDRIIDEIKKRKEITIEEIEKQYGSLRKLREEHGNGLGMSSEEIEQMKKDDELFKKTMAERLKRISLLSIYLLSKFVKLTLKKF